MKVVKLTENRGSYKIVIPKNMILDTKLQDETEVEVKRVGKHIVIKKVE